ncbi:uncharacterized protein BXZ73DRAFT_99863 [Epithele typhae]|uniref:uncharacterized protein n=1 Tax=Epithele typhae TaxID=378194 RepID=UPI002008B5BC|nr:uncharacterized protein BXZ73DRAFT_99863 [Epithele typhae]KAH9938802.1 hypothetical protein BXZ73DRAFT_99863 [Epithele typhae]
MGLSIITVNLALVCVESALYGVFFVLAVTSLAVLVVRHGQDSAGAALSLRATLRSPLFLATVILLMTVSAHWLLTVRRLFDAYVYTNGGEEPATYYLEIEAATHVASTAFVIASVIVGDIILIYRIWVVWGHRWSMIIFPALCTMGYAASGTSVVQLFATFVPGESIFVSESQRRVITTVALTLSTNIYGSVSIAYRIWTTNRAMKNERMMLPGMSLTEAFVIFVESAALYTFWTLFFLCAYAAQSLLEAFAFHNIPAATGISFMLIIVRVGLGFSFAHPPTPHDPGATRLVAFTVSRTVAVERSTDFALPPRRRLHGAADPGVLSKRDLLRAADGRESDEFERELAGAKDAPGSQLAPLPRLARSPV